MILAQGGLAGELEVVRAVQAARGADSEPDLASHIPFDRGFCRGFGEVLAVLSD